MFTRQELEEKIHRAGYRVTSTRRIILGILVNSSGKLTSAEKILEASKAKQAKINFSTIYRNLEFLQSIGIVHKISFPGGAARFGLVCSESHHHHLICKECGRFECIGFCPWETVSEIAREKKFTVTGHKMEIFGYCSYCKPTQS